MIKFKQNVGKLTCDLKGEITAINIVVYEHVFPTGIYKQLIFKDEKDIAIGYCNDEYMNIEYSLKPIIATLEYRKDLLQFVDILIKNRITVTFIGKQLW